MSNVGERILGFAREKSHLRDMTADALLTSPLRDLIDSVEMIKLLLFVESEFAITVEDDEIGPDTFGTLAAITEFVRRKTGL